VRDGGVREMSRPAEPSAVTGIACGQHQRIERAVSGGAIRGGYAPDLHASCVGHVRLPPHASHEWTGLS
jgi:hypothetical protein